MGGAQRGAAGAWARREGRRAAGAEQHRVTEAMMRQNDPHWHSNAVSSQRADMDKERAGCGRLKG